MEIKVKALEDGHEKSTAQVEEILLEKHEEKQNHKAKKKPRLYKRRLLKKTQE